MILCGFDKIYVDLTCFKIYVVREIVSKSSENWTHFLIEKRLRIVLSFFHSNYAAGEIFSLLGCVTNNNVQNVRNENYFTFFSAITIQLTFSHSLNDLMILFPMNYKFIAFWISLEVNLSVSLLERKRREYSLGTHESFKMC